jgi:hypothetical protein
VLRVRIGIALVIALVSATVARAATYVVPTDRDLVRRADAIVVGRAVESHAVANETRGIETLTSFIVEERIKGRVGETFELFEPGGALPDVVQYVPGAPRFVPGSEYVLFLHRAPDGRLTTHGLGLGKFEFTTDLYGTPLLGRGPSEAPMGWDERDGSLYIERLRRVPEFLSFVRTISRSPNSPAAENYYLPIFESIDAMLVIRPTATYSRGQYMLANPPRWNNGATASIGYCCSPTYQPSPFDGPTAATTATGMWGSTGAIHYTISGANTATTGLSGADLKSTILFNDPNNYLAGYGSGIVALGGVTAASGTTYTLDGEVFYPTKEIDVVVAKNTHFPTGVSQDLFTGVIVHELGHTLGFRHADGTSASSSPPPSCAAPLPCASGGQAMMEHALVRTTLGQWDIDAAKTVYGPCPYITSQPQSTTVSAGSSVTLSVSANGGSPTYQWFNGTPGSGTALSGQTGSSLTVSPTATTSYYVVVTSCSSSATSTAATITISGGCSTPTINTQPQSITINSGASTTLSVSATGTNLTYQWFTGTPGSGTAINGETASTMTVSPTSTTSYYVVLTACSTSVNSTAATVTVCNTPSITTQPQSTTITAGSSTTLTVAATGSSPTYQWFTGSPGTGTAINGQTGTSLLVTPPSTTTYHVRVTACGTTVNSSAATVTVCSPPSITSQPQSQTVSAGASTTLSVGATGTGLTYQWFQGSPGSGSPIGGATGSSFTFAPSSSGTYYVVVSASCGSPVTSNAATITICSAPAITTQPQGITINSGSSTTLTAAASGTNVTYQWFTGSPGSGTAINAATSPSLTVSPSITTTYYVVATACGNSVTSNGATVTICNTPSITGQPQSASINSGSSTTLSVTATGTNATYQWFQGSPGSGAVINGQIASSITVAPTSTTSYYVVVTSCGTAVTSAAATVTVCALPAITAQPQNKSINSGSSTTLNVTATGTNVTYQWFQGSPGSGTAINGQTTAALTVSPTSTTSYYVVVSACSTSVTSAAATVTVCSTPAITGQPQSVSINSGSSTTLTVAATGTSATYQWFQGTPGSGTPINGQITSSLTVSPGATTTYYVVVTACGTSVTSSAATVTVCNTPAITGQPQSTSINAGNSTTLSVTATGTSVTYQWFQGTPGSGSAINGQTGTSMIVSPSSTTTYYVVVTACATSVTSSAATVTVCNPPAITAQPQSATITSGTPTTLSVTATGTTPTYQWFTGSPGTGTAINGQTASTLTVSPTSTTSYYVVVTGCGTPVTSAAATLTVTVTCNTPVITGQPQSVSINSGSSTTLTVTATGTNLTYQWYQGTPGTGTLLNGQTGSSLTVSPTSTTSYYVEATACSTSVNSTAATVSVCTPPAINGQPQSASINSGSSVVLTVSATGTSATYQWFQGTPGLGTPISGQTGTSMTVSPTTTTTYYVVVTACGTSVTSSAATITVCSTPAITGQPQSVAINAGTTTTLSVSATGTSVTYQWFLGAPGSGTVFNGETASTLTVTPTSTTSYHVVVSACGTSVTSAAATVTVCSPPAITGQPQSTTINSGNSTTLNVTATGTNVTYQWFQGAAGSGTPLNGQIGASLTVSPTSTTSYYVVVTACGVSSTSSAATVTVCNPPSITAQPQGVSINSGSSATLSVTATGTNVTYLWYQGTPGNSTPISAETSASITLTPDVTTTFYVVVSGCGTSVTSAAATITVCVTPVINAQPQSVTITSGNSTTLTVGATGTGLTYQWFSGAPGSGKKIANETAASITVTPNTTTSYYAVVTACGVSATSAAATVTVQAACSAPAITAQPQSATITAGNPATMSVSATGTNLVYQWFQGSPGSGTAINGETATSLTVSPSVTTTYYVVVTACSSSVTSTVATITVAPVCNSPAITTQPQSTTINAGSSATLSVAATGTNLTYQWYQGTPGSGTAIGGQSNASMTISPSSTTSYYVVLTSCGSTVTSTAATVTVNPVCSSPVITSQPQSITIATGTSTTLSVTATGTNVIYQWYRGNPGSGTNLGGQTGSTLTVSPSSTTNYYVVVTACGVSVTSSAATVTVVSCIAPSITTQPQTKTVIAGNSTTLSVTASGTALTYQWYLGTSGTVTNPITGATASTLTVTPATTTSYWVRVGGQCGYVYSVTATVRIPSYWAVTGE